MERNYESEKKKRELVYLLDFKYVLENRHPRIARSRDRSVRIGPRFSNFLAPGPIWLGISKIFLGPRTIQFWFVDLCWQT